MLRWLFSHSLVYALPEAMVGNIIKTDTGIQIKMWTKLHKAEQQTVSSFIYFSKNCLEVGHVWISELLFAFSVIDLKNPSFLWTCHTAKTGKFHFKTTKNGWFICRQQGCGAGAQEAVIFGGAGVAAVFRI